MSQNASSAQWLQCGCPDTQQASVTTCIKCNNRVCQQCWLLPKYAEPTLERLNVLCKPCAETDTSQQLPPRGTKRPCGCFLRRTNQESDVCLMCSKPLCSDCWHNVDGSKEPYYDIHNIPDDQVLLCHECYLQDEITLGPLKCCGAYGFYGASDDMENLTFNLDRTLFRCTECEIHFCGRCDETPGNTNRPWCLGCESMFRSDLEAIDHKRQAREREPPMYVKRRKLEK